MGTTTITPTKPEAPPKPDDGGRGRGGFGDDGFGGGGEPSYWRVPARAYRTGMWMALVAIIMLFAAFTSALVVRQGISTDWRHIELPRVLWLNTVILLASSLTLELSRRSLSAGLLGQFTRWWYGTTALGLGFIAGQWVAWRDFASRGVYLATNPSSSFFYLLTAAHGVHLLGGILALVYIAFRIGHVTLRFTRWFAVDVAAIYWHFMDGLWVYIFLLLLLRL